MVVLFIAIVMTFLAFLFNKSKVMTLCMFTFMWILYGWNSYNGDYEGYEKVYNSSLLAFANENYEIGFRILCVGGNLLGLSFQAFLVVLAATILVLWFRFIIRYSAYPALVSVVFFWIFFPLDYVLIRNFFAFSIVIQGIGCLIDNVKYKYVKYTFFVLLAFTIHSSSILYLCFLLLALKDGREIKFLNIFIIALFGMIFYVTLAQGIIVGLLSSSGSRDEFYQSNLITFIFLFVYQLIGTIFIIYLYSKLRPDFVKSTNPNMYLVLLNINIIIFFVTILYFDFSIFVRIYRNIAIVNCVFITNGFVLLPKANIGLRAKVAVFFVFYLIFFFSYFITPFMDDTLFALFNYNLLLS